MKITKQKFYLLCIAFLFVTSFISAQTVQKIGVNAMTIDPNAVLELNSPTKGLLLPRLALVNTGSFAPMASSPTAGMTVYNTTVKSGVEGSTEVTPGFYYWDGTQWVRVGDSSSNTQTITTKTGSYTALAKDNTILFNIGAAATLTLPAAAAGNKGKIYVIRKVDVTAFVLTFSQTITNNTGETFTELNYSKTIRIQSGPIDETADPLVYRWNLID
jgi:hypothetical protein